MIWVREFEPGPRGRLFATLFRVVGERLFTGYARDVLTNLERVDRNDGPYEPHDGASDTRVQMSLPPSRSGGSR